MLVGHDKRIAVRASPLRELEGNARAVCSRRGDGVDAYRRKEELLGDRLDLHRHDPMLDMSGDSRRRRCPVARPLEALAVTCSCLPKEFFVKYVDDRGGQVVKRLGFEQREFSLLGARLEVKHLDLN